MLKFSIHDQSARRILILDGGLGTMIQGYGLSEEDYRGTRFADWKILLKGCNDLLVLTRPQVIAEIHEAYLKAGADIISTDTFNASAVSMADYGLEAYVYEMNRAAAALARKVADGYTLRNPSKPRFVAGSIGPTNRTASISPDVNNPGYRAVTFDDLRASYAEQVRGLLDGGADVLLIETIFDTLNAKAALFAIEETFAERGRRIPVMVSGTITDASGRTLSGQTIEAFYASIAHANPFSVGLNCGYGAELMLPYIERLAAVAGCAVSSHPNAGLPNGFGGYDETPEMMAATIGTYLDKGLLNIVGGCCGTTPEHIAAIAQVASKYTPRAIPEPEHVTTLSGLETLRITPEANFVNVGERTNVAGSAKFAGLIREKKYEEALSVARQQVEGGAQIVDICMDDGLIDGPTAMRDFLNLVMSEPDIARVPVMIDSSKWEVLETGLKCVQGKSVVNSISLKEGEREFLHRAGLIRRYGAAAVVMLFDEQGQADTFERKIAVAGRAYKLLTENGFPAEDIIFDPNVLSVATGIEEHDGYGIDFIRACGWIKANCPYAKVSGGVSSSETRVAAAVMATEKATSPRAMKVSTLEAVPPGAVPTRIMPMASSGGRANTWHRAKASSGIQPNCTTSPSPRSRGCRSTWLKSCQCRVMPMPSMMMPSMAEICGATQEKIQGCHRASAEKAMMMTPMKRVRTTLSLRRTDSIRPPPLRT